MKVLFCCLIVFMISCQSRLETQKIEDYGTKQIGDNLYLKKLCIGQHDRVYLLVDKDGNLASTGTSTNYTVSNGKSSYDVTNTLIKAEE